MTLCIRMPLGSLLAVGLSTCFPPDDLQPFEPTCSLPCTPWLCCHQEAARSAAIACKSTGLRGLWFSRLLVVGVPRKEMYTEDVHRRFMLGTCQLRMPVACTHVGKRLQSQHATSCTEPGSDIGGG